MIGDAFAVFSLLPTLAGREKMWSRLEIEQERATRRTQTSEKDLYTPIFDAGGEALEGQKRLILGKFRPRWPRSIRTMLQNRIGLAKKS